MVNCVFVVISRVPLKSQNLRTQLGEKLLNLTSFLLLRHTAPYEKITWIHLSVLWEIGIRLLSFRLGWDKGRVNWLALPSFCCVLRIQKYVLHMLVFCYFHVALASLQHGVHGGRKGWVLRKLLWVEIILFPFTKSCFWSPLQVPCLCSMPLELYARKQYDLSNWASGRRGTGWASMPWQLTPKNRSFASWINILGTKFLACF